MNHQKELLTLFATCPKGLELLLVEELRALGAVDPAEKLAGVTFKGTLALAYQACLWSRFANRILLSLNEFSAESPEELYAGVQQIAWSEHLNVDGTLAVHAVCAQSEITHSLFAAQKVKDAVVDQLREEFGERPNVSRDRPDVSIYVYIYRNRAKVYLDLSGESLHKRGYRLWRVEAPLKENVAAAILTRAGWQAIAKEGGSLMDPMCGSGTFLIEAAFIAADRAPGLTRDYFGFLGWKQHDASCWKKLMADATARFEQGIKTLPTIVGYDQDSEAIKVAFENIESAGLLGKIHVEKRELNAFVPKSNVKEGLVVVNPPYGERLGELENLQPLYTELGAQLKNHFAGWRAAVFTGNPDLGKQMGLRAEKYYALFNGPIPCKLLLFMIEQKHFVDRSLEAENARAVRKAQQSVTLQHNDAIQAFINRVRKNLKHLKKQALRENKEMFRVYDADLPEYVFAIDVYADKVCVQEYEAPKNIATAKVLRRRQEVLAVLPDLLELPASQLFFSVIPKKLS